MPCRTLLRRALTSIVAVGLGLLSVGGLAGPGPAPAAAATSDEVVFRRMLFLLDGPDHRRVRMHFAKWFLGPNAVRQITPQVEVSAEALMRESAAEVWHLRRWRASRWSITRHFSRVPRSRQLSGAGRYKALGSGIGPRWRTLPT